MSKLNIGARDLGTGIPACTATWFNGVKRLISRQLDPFFALRAHAGRMSVLGSGLLSRALLLWSFALLIATTSLGQPALRSITINTEPDATVWIDGVRYGVTDSDGKLKIASVLPGVRNLRVRAIGFSEVRKSLPAPSRGDVTIKLVETKDEAELAYQQAEAQTTVDRERAISEYQRAIKLRPNFVDAYIGLARAYAERNDVENTFKAVQSAKRLRPGNAEVSVIEGRLLKDSGEEDKAIRTFKRAITEGRGFQPEAYTGLGLLYKDRAENAGGSGDYDAEAMNYNEAAKNLAMAVKQLGSSPDAIVVQQLLGLIYEKQKKYKEAIAVYEDFLRIFPDAAAAEAVRSFIIQIKKQSAEQP
jgi:Tfp pilus assembly protein PilF